MSISSRSSAYWKRSLHTLTLVRICALVYMTARGCCRRGALNTSAVWQNWQRAVSQSVRSEDETRRTLTTACSIAGRICSGVRLVSRCCCGFVWAIVGVVVFLGGGVALWVR